VIEAEAFYGNIYEGGGLCGEIGVGVMLEDEED
jgi:hypothetical protein